MAEHETIADIIAEMRGQAGDDGYPLDIKHYADRLEAAHRREVATTKESLAVGNSGDSAKLREALFASRDFICRVLMFLHGMETTFPGEDEITDKIRSALGEAPKMAPDPRSHIFKI